MCLVAGVRRFKAGSAAVMHPEVDAHRKIFTSRFKVEFSGLSTFHSCDAENNSPSYLRYRQIPI